MWLAEDERLGRAVAVKRIPMHDAATAARAEREGLVAAQLGHPGIVALFEAGRDEDAVYLVSELVRGRPLAELMADGALSDRDVVQVGVALCDALAHAHARGVVHRDVKPGNVLVPESSRDGAGVAKLTDFGVARMAGDEALTRTGDVVGTLAYMAPEQAAGRAADAAADLYALGLVVFEGLAGVNPVRGRGRRRDRPPRRPAPARRSRACAATCPRSCARRSTARCSRDPSCAAGCATCARRSPRPSTAGSSATSRAPSCKTERAPGPATTRPRCPTFRTPCRTEAIPPRPRAASPATASWMTLGRRRRGPGRAPHRAPGLRDGDAAPAGERPRASARAPVRAARWRRPRSRPARQRGSCRRPRSRPRRRRRPRCWASASCRVSAGSRWRRPSRSGRPRPARAGSPCSSRRPALPTAALLRRAGTLWSAPALAPLLGAVALAGAWPALAGQAARAWHRAALGALGLWWLVLAEVLTGSRLALGPAPDVAARPAWDGSATAALRDAIGPALTGGALALAAVWAVAAVLLPVVVRGRSFAVDLVGVTVWAAALGSATEAVAAALSSPDAPVSMRGLVAGAVAAGAVAVAARASRGRRRDRPFAPFRLRSMAAGPTE